MSYNILNKNVNFQGATAGTVEGLVDSHSDQSISGSKDFLSLTASVGRVANDLTVLGNVSASVNISASAFYGDGSNLSNVGAVTALNGATSAANSRITTANGTELDAEGSLTFNGTTNELVVGSSLLNHSTASFYGIVSASQEISASSFWGDGSNLSGIDSVTLASNSGLDNSSGLIVDPNNATEETSANNSHFLLIYNGSALRKITCERVVGLVDVSDFMSNGVDNRVLTAAGADTMNAESKLLFDGSVLTVDGNISGSGTIQNVGAATFTGNITTSGTLGGAGIDLDDASGIAGLGLVDGLLGTLNVQTSGAVKITSDKVVLTGSLAGYGLTYSGSVNAISGITLDLGSLTEEAINRSNDYIVFIDADDSGNAKKESVVDLVGFIAGSGLNASSGQLSVDTSTFTFTTLSASSTLQAVGATTLGNTLTVSGSSALAAISGSGTLQAVGATTLGNTLTVSGSSTLQGVTLTTLSASSTLQIVGATTLGNSLSVSGSSTLQAVTFTTLSGSSTLQAVGNATFGGALSVSGTITAPNLTYNGSLLEGTNVTSSFRHYAAGQIGGIGDTQTAYYNASGSNTDLYMQINEQGNLSPLFAIAGTNHATVPGQIKTLCTLSSSAGIKAGGDAKFEATLAVTGSGTFEDSLTVKGPLICDMSPVTNFTGDDANATIPITSATAQIDANGSARSGMRFAGGGTAGQFLTVINTGGENVSFHNTEGTCLVRGINSNKDTIRPGEAHLFISDGTLWNHVGGGATDEWMTAG